MGALPPPSLARPLLVITAAGSLGEQKQAHALSIVLQCSTKELKEKEKKNPK